MSRIAKLYLFGWWQNRGHLLTAVGVAGSALTLFTAIIERHELSYWIQAIVDAWRGATHAFWTSFVAWLGLDLPDAVVIVLNFTIFALGIAIGVRLRARFLGPSSNAAYDSRTRLAAVIGGSLWSCAAVALVLGLFIAMLGLGQLLGLDSLWVFPFIGCAVLLRSITSLGCKLALCISRENGSRINMQWLAEWVLSLALAYVFAEISFSAVISNLAASADKLGSALYNVTDAIISMFAGAVTLLAAPLALTYPLFERINGDDRDSQKLYALMLPYGYVLCVLPFSRTWDSNDGLSSAVLLAALPFVVVLVFSLMCVLAPKRDLTVRVAYSLAGMLLMFVANEGSKLLFPSSVIPLPD